MQQVYNALLIPGFMFTVYFLGVDQARGGENAVAARSHRQLQRLPLRPILSNSDFVVSSPVPTESEIDIVSPDPDIISTTTGDASDPSDSGLFPTTSKTLLALLLFHRVHTLTVPSSPVSASNPPIVPLPVAPPSCPVSTPAPPTNGVTTAPVQPTLPSPPSAHIKAKQGLIDVPLPSGYAAFSADTPILLGTGGAKDASDASDPSTTVDGVSASKHRQ